MTQMFVDTA